MQSELLTWLHRTLRSAQNQPGLAACSGSRIRAAAA